MISLTRRIVTEKTSFVIKQCPNPPPHLYQRESEGLKALGVEGGPRIPQVLRVSDEYLLLEDLGKNEPGPGFWAKFGQQVALMHQVTRPKYGFDHDNYLGLQLMDNTWSDDGWEFFARTRVLRFLGEPLCEEFLTTQDRSRVERLAAQLPSLIPFQPPSLIHGDLWTSNMLVAPDGSPAVIDPATYFGWPEAELSMTCAYDGVGPEFFDAYREINPLESGWQSRFEILGIREMLSMIAHTGNEYGTVQALRAVLEKYA